MHNTRWTKQDIELLKENYPEFGKKFCMNLLSRTEASIRSKVTSLGLKSSFKFSPEVCRKRASHLIGRKRPDHSQWLKENHPLKGKHHTPETKKKISERAILDYKNGLRKEGGKKKGRPKTAEDKKRISDFSKKMWADPNHKLNSEEHKQKQSDRMSKMQQAGMLNRYSRGRGSHVFIEGKKYWFRSSWEVIYAKYLQFMKEGGAINGWEYEVDTFWFEKIKRGVRSYKPDFKVWYANGEVEYHEVKGWMDAKSKTKLKRMAKYHPDVKIVLIRDKKIREIKKMGFTTDG